MRPGSHLPRLLLALALVGAVAAAGAAGAGARKPAPAGLIGVAPQTLLTTEDMQRMRQARVRTIRVPLPWYLVAPTRAAASRPDWRAFEHVLTLTSKAGMTVLPFLYGTPPWVARDARIEPTFSGRARRHWSAFLRRAASRFGPGGHFWDAHPELPPRPIRWWQIWNEPNIVSFSRRPSPRRYAVLVRTSARALHAVNPGAKIVAAGLFGRPLQTPPNVRPTHFLRRALEGTGLRRALDAVALHPYMPRAREMPSKIVAMRRVLRRFGRSRMPLWITEMGWGSDSRESMWERGWRGQARELNAAMRLLIRSRSRWRVQRIYWYSWIDAPVCQFCDSAGLFTRRGRPKPAWYAFNSWTGGYAGLPSQP